MEVARSRVTPLGVDETSDAFPSWSLAFAYLKTFISLNDI
jgi:hypothetical protein